MSHSKKKFTLADKRNAAIGKKLAKIQDVTEGQLKKGWEKAAREKVA